MQLSSRRILGLIVGSALVWLTLKLVPLDEIGPMLGTLGVIALFFSAWSADDRRGLDEFAPFRVRIKVYRAFLFESGICTEQQLTDWSTKWQVSKQAEPDSSHQPHSLLTHGLDFTLLKPGTGVEDGLVFWNPHGAFSTGIDHAEVFGEFAVPGHSPHVRLKWSAEGLSIRAWPQHPLSQADPAGDWENDEPGDDEDEPNEDELDEDYRRVKDREMALLPLSVFRVRQWGWDAKTDRTSDALKKLGWEEEERDWEVPSMPYRFTHKYCRVEWWYI